MSTLTKKKDQHCTFIYYSRRYKLGGGISIKKIKEVLSF